MPSPELGKSSTTCLSVLYDLNGDGRVESFLMKALEAGICERLLEKSKDDSGRHVYVHVHFPTGFFSAGIDRDDLVNIIERERAMSAI